LATRYQDYLATTIADIGDICFTANVGRSHFNYRQYIVTSSITQLGEQLADFVAEVTLHLGQIKDSSTKKLAFIFTDFGCQYAEMGH
jgi:acyl transferase domain-containing protein